MALRRKAKVASTARLFGRGLLGGGGGSLPLSISGANGTAMVGDTAPFAPSISGGTAPYTVTVTGLPPGRGIANAATGQTTGAFTTAGSYSATYTVTDSVGATASFTRTVTVSDVQLAKWKAALAARAAGTKAARLLVIGDGNAAGQTGSQGAALPAGNKAISWPSKIAEAYGSIASTDSFFGNQNTASVNPYGATSGASYDPRLTMSGVTLGGTSLASLGQFPFLFSSASSVLDYAPARDWDTAEIFYVRDTTAAAAYAAIDGGASLLALSRQNNTGGQGVGKATLTVPLGRSVFNFRWTSGTFPLVGVIFSNSTSKEIQVVNISMDSASAQDYVKFSTVPPVGQMNSLDRLAPDLTIIQQAYKDISSNYNLNLSRTNIQTLATYMHELGSDVILVSGSQYDTTLTNMNSTRQLSYTDAFKSVATNQAFHYLDLYTDFGTTTVAKAAGRMDSGQQRYPNAAGYAWIATYIKAGIDAGLTQPAVGYPAPQTYDVTDAASLMAIYPVPGSTVRIARNTTYAGPFTLGWSGAPGKPITVTTTGPTAAPAVFTGTPSADLATPNNINAIDLYGSYIDIDGGQIDGGFLGLWIKDTGRTGLRHNFGHRNLTVKNIEVSNCGLAFQFDGDNVKAAGNYDHDLILVRNTPVATNADDDFGANAYTISGNNVEVAYCRSMRGRGPSFDYGTDGGTFELFPLARTITGFDFHHNYVEGGDRVLEGGAPSNTGAVIDKIDFQGNVCINNKGFCVIHNGGGNFAASWLRQNYSFNTFLEENNTISTSQHVVIDATPGAGFQNPDYGFNNNIVQMNDGKAVFKQQQSTYHRNNVFYLLNKDPANTGNGADSTKTHLYDSWNMDLGTGEVYATSAVFTDQATRNLTPIGVAVGKGHTVYAARPLLGISTIPADYRAP